jgi:4-alpha-glucanotransferase
MTLQRRISGVLLPLSSLPGSPLCGNIGAGARRFANFLQQAGQRVWQMLPVNPIDECFSPYASISTFAGDPIYIDLTDLKQNGLLDDEDLSGIPAGPKTRSAFCSAKSIYPQRLHKAFQRFRETTGTKYHQAFETFIDSNPWVGPHSVFCALSERFGTNDWLRWTDASLRHADQDALHRVVPELEYHVAYYAFEQLVFDVQWNELHEYCRSKGIALVGDVPIYVSKHSVDTWANRHLFHMEPDGELSRVAGVPGDSFNPDGQRWNSPLFDWQKHKETGYDWWLQRLGKAFCRFDAVRLDHFIGFYNYFSMTPEPDPNDAGFWVAGPADGFFEAVLKAYPGAQLIAEDLGVMKPEVHQLRDKFHFPGINVFQFSFDFRRNTDATLQWNTNSVVCTGTHDTNTAAAWFDEVLLDRKKPEPIWEFPTNYKMIKDILPPNVPVNRQTVIWGLVRKVLSSPGNVAVFPMQDLLGLGGDCRMNFPGHADGNWLWRLDEAYLTDELAQRLRLWTQEFGR